MVFQQKAANAKVNEEKKMDPHESPSSKCKRFIRLSPKIKKKHSRSKETSPSTPKMDRAEKGRIPNGFTEAASADLKQAFDLFDKNKDGKISSEELGCVLRTLGHNYSKKDVEEMIKNADTNENGYVEFDEFLTMMRRANANMQVDCDTSSSVLKDDEETRKREAFKVFDMDGNGYIDKHELRYVMRRLGENLSEDDIKAMFKEADLNGDGLIDYSEFSRLMSHFVD